jgi:hypothetical protein
MWLALLGIFSVPFVFMNLGAAGKTSLARFEKQNLEK